MEFDILLKCFIFDNDFAIKIICIMSYDCFTIRVHGIWWQFT